MQELILNLREKLNQIVAREKASHLLFSGGLDTSILAGLNPRMETITVSLESFGEDISYAKLVARHLNLTHYHRIVTVDEAISFIPNLIKILRSFDPAIPNDIAVYSGLLKAKELGATEIMTGDGADEIFGGYDYMRQEKDLDTYLKRVSLSMSFNSNRIGDYLGIDIIQPYLEKELVEYALQIPSKLKIRQEMGKLWGKWILRKAFEGLLPEEIIWQEKRPIEQGSGMVRLREIISSKISDEEFEEKKKIYPIKFLNKEHLYYFEVYKNEVGDIPEPKFYEKRCPGCGAGMSPSGFHCRICGYFIEWEEK